MAREYILRGKSITMNAFFSLNKRMADALWFQTTIILTIVAAGVLVGIQTYGDSVERWHDLIVSADNIILLIFTIEVFVKVFAEGRKPWRYFFDAWNIFDFLIVAVCYVAVFMPSVDASFVAVLRLARILRVFKLVTAVPKLQLLVGALLRSIPSMGYVGILLFLLFYIYACMAVFIFGGNDPLHFGDLQNAMLSLFRVVTLEDWTDVMYINMYGCDHPIWGYGEECGCTDPVAFGWGSPAFFVSFVLIGTMIVLNLFIGVIMNSMDEAQAEADAAMKVSLESEGNYTPVDELHELSTKLEGLKHELDAVYHRLKVPNSHG